MKVAVYIETDTDDIEEKSEVMELASKLSGMVEHTPYSSYCRSLGKDEGKSVWVARAMFHHDTDWDFETVIAASTEEKAKQALLDEYNEALVENGEVPVNFEKYSNRFKWEVLKLPVL